jgi:hypothetical protein
MPNAKSFAAGWTRAVERAKRLDRSVRSIERLTAPSRGQSGTFGVAAFKSNAGDWYGHSSPATLLVS